MLKTVTKVPMTALTTLQNNVKLPAKLKGTIIEKWADYWKNLFIDYRQMLQDLRTDIQDDPKKALLWTGGLISTYFLAKNNPNEIDFRDSLKKIENEIVLVSDECRNSKSVEHLNYLGRCYNEKVIFYRNLGLFSIMYTTDLNTSCDLYKAQCSYLQPQYVSFPSRIVDFGIMGRWWNIFIKTANYDVNV